MDTPADIESVVHRFQFVTLAFDKPQTVFRLPQWHWPVTRPYNGFSGGARIRGWQLNRFYRQNGWLRYGRACSVTGAVGDVGLHNEDYSKPWAAYPVSKRAHTLIHTRARFPKAWAAFLATEALSDTWARTLSIDGGVATADRDCNVVHLLEHAPHPPWVVVRENEFDRR
ncbi:MULTISPECIES: hypothetical protein [unclassified Caballeronia]|uniref:hypothetical protein n=1 Tax=unclassified Caballeronia TaxID=2646786 RepID=UPI001F2F1F1B|nr:MULTISPECIES: hypothetical protein [unclassified Caballeronia]MCE4543413.1 hypothetical protein [Caballeronia sp. PC1]MCE4567531.1 hypothetical protein [Caballeronia sp. CLC5]